MINQCLGNGCEYLKKEIVQGIEHEKCANENLNQINHSNGKDIPCMGNTCGYFKKKVIIVALLFAGILFSARAQIKYYDDGNAEPFYLGTTKTTTLDDAYTFMLNRLRGFNPISFSGKLSKAQKRLFWNALGQYDYKPGEIYMVSMVEYGSFIIYEFVLQIEADGSATWKGISLI